MKPHLQLRQNAAASRKFYADDRAHCADNPQRLDAIDAQEAQEMAFYDGHPTVLPPCPSWCRYAEDGHLYSDEAGGTYTRYHDWSAGDDVDGCAVVAERNRDGVITYGPPTVITDAGDELTPDEARARARQWLALADMAEQAAAEAAR